MLIRNARILTEKAGLIEGCLRIRNGRIDRLAQVLAPEEGEEIVEANGKILVPGLIDIHNHGYAGTEFATPDGPFENGLLELAKKGITTVVPTLRPLRKDRLLAAIENAKREIRKAESGRGPAAAKPAGIHLEGPFVSPGKAGAMVRSNLSLPDRKDLAEYLEAGEGMIKTVAFAPELDGACDLIGDILSAGANASVAHTNATFEQAKAAADRGANLVTHLFNAMSGFGHREPGTVGEALTDDRLTCELICDFVHNAPAAVDLALRAKGPDRIVMISDTGVMAGLGDGEFIIEGVKRIVRGNTCRTESGTIAGSVCDLSVGFRNLMKAGYALADVSHMTSRNPARMIGLDAETGTIEEGKAADLILLSADWTPSCVWVDGKEVSSIARAD